MTLAYFIILAALAIAYYKVKREEDRLYRELCERREAHLRALNATLLPRPIVKNDFGNFYEHYK